MALAAAAYPRDKLNKAVVLPLNQLVQIKIAFYVHNASQCKVQYQLPKVCINIHRIHCFSSRLSQKKGDLKHHFTAYCKVLTQCT
jgi:hypothetical protein